MALHLTAKAPEETLDYRWEPPLDEGDGLASYTITLTGATLGANAIDGNGVAFYVSGGSAGATAIIELTAETNEGRWFEETLYLPIRASANALGYTVRDVCGFALRKVVGIDSDPDATELADAVERLNDMLAMWRIDGLDIGAALPLVSTDTLLVRDEFITAVKFNLRIACHDHYDAPITAYDADMADKSKRLISNLLLDLGDLSMPSGLSSRSAADLF